MSKILVIGTGRCGTGYFAEVFKRLGVIASHEEIFNRESLTPQSIPSWPNMIELECSWMAVFQAKVIKATNKDVKVIHLLRNPLDTVRSFMRLGFFDNVGVGETVNAEMAVSYRGWAQSMPGYPHAIESDSPLVRAIRWWNTLNNDCHDVADSTVKIENFDENTIAHVFKLLNLKKPPKSEIVKVLADTPKEWNHKLDDLPFPELDLSQISVQIADRWNQQAIRWGYPTPIK